LPISYRMWWLHARSLIRLCDIKLKDYRWKNYFHEAMNHMDAVKKTINYKKEKNLYFHFLSMDQLEVMLLQFTSCLYINIHSTMASSIGHNWRTIEKWTCLAQTFQNKKITAFRKMETHTQTFSHEFTRMERYTIFPFKKPTFTKIPIMFSQIEESIWHFGNLKLSVTKSVPWHGNTVNW
jgi:hypothetical protein